MDFDPVERQIYALQAGDLVLAEASGSASQVGRSALWSDEIPGCCFQNTVIRFRPHAVKPEFAQLVLQHFSRSGAFASIARGVGIQHLGAAPFARMDFPVPPLAEQDKIAAETTRQLQQLAESRESLESALRRTVQQDNTIIEAAVLGGLIEPLDIDPVQLLKSPANAASPSLFGANELDGQPDQEFADLMSRALPRGWQWVRVDQVGDVRLGRQRSPEHEYGEHMVSYLRVANVFEDRIDTTDVRKMNFTPKEQETYSLEHGDILLNEGQSPELVGRSAMYTGDPPGACFQNTLLRFRHATFVDPNFAQLVFRHYLRAGHFTRIARWSTNIAHLGAERLASMPFPLPPFEEQGRIATEARTRLDASSAQREAVEKSIERLGEMRDGIIRSAVSGATVPQSPDDEPAEQLLARLGPPPEQKIDTVGKERRMTRRGKQGDVRKKPLYDTIVILKNQVTPELLFKAAGYDPDSVADVESFYLALREELGVRIRQIGTAHESRLEVIQDAT